MKIWLMLLGILFMVITAGFFDILRGLEETDNETFFDFFVATGVSFIISAMCFLFAFGEKLMEIQEPSVNPSKEPK